MSSRFSDRASKGLYEPYESSVIGQRIESLKLLVASLSLLLICSISACKRPLPQRTVLVHSLRCLQDRPPKLNLIQSVKEGCPTEYVCIRRQDAIDLATWISLIATWAEDAWSRCGPLPSSDPRTEKL